MWEVGTGLLWGRGKCIGKSCGINEIRADLVFREVPAKLLQWRRQSQGFWCCFLCRALVNPPGDGVARIARAPVRLRFLTAGCLAIRLVAGPLPVAHSQIRPEPSAAYRARSL